MTNQDASAAAGMPLGVFHNGTLLAVAPAWDTWGVETLKAIAAERGINRIECEILILCHRHPTVAAVDCTNCDPI